MVTTVIVPIYNQTEVTSNCIESVLRAKVEKTFRLILLNDASTEASMVPALSQFEGDPRVEVHTNPENLGFTKTVNKGIRLAGPDSNPLLLNSDTLVYDHWIDAMHETLYSSSNIATVTPLTNQSGSHVTCYPHQVRADVVYEDLPGEQLSQLAYQHSRGLDIQVHTGVGFCLLINRAAIDEAGQLDEVHFPRGYGEESDFCYRTRYLGWRHLVCGGTFVTHLHAQSFGSKKQQLLREMVKVFQKLHPTQPDLDTAFRSADPLRPLRRQLDLARLRESVKSSDLAVVSSGSKPPAGRPVYLEADGHNLSVKVSRKSVGFPNMESYDLRYDIARLLKDLQFASVRSIDFSGSAGAFTLISEYAEENKALLDFNVEASDNTVRFL